MERLGPRPRLYNDAYEAIQQFVVREGLRPGDSLPSERQIQEQLGISRAPVREALRALQIAGLIEARQGKGLFVKEMDLRPMVDAFVTHLSLFDRDSFDHMLDLRQILELGAAELAAMRRTPLDLSRMATILDAMRDRVNHEELSLDEDMGFHAALVRAAHNPPLEHFYACMTPFLMAVREGGKATHQDIAECWSDHTTIYQAVHDQDAALAVRLMQEHLSSVREQLKERSESTAASPQKGSVAAEHHQAG